MFPNDDLLGRNLNNNSNHVEKMSVVKLKIICSGGWKCFTLKGSKGYCISWKCEFIPLQRLLTCANLDKTVKMTVIMSTQGQVGIK